MHVLKMSVQVPGPFASRVFASKIVKDTKTENRTGVIQWKTFETEDSAENYQDA